MEIAARHTTRRNGRTSHAETDTPPFLDGFPPETTNMHGLLPHTSHAVAIRRKRHDFAG